MTNNGDGSSSFRVVSDKIDLVCSWTDAFAADTALTFALLPDVTDDVNIDDITVSKSVVISASGSVNPNAAADGLEMSFGEWGNEGTWRMKGSSGTTEEWA